MRASPITIAALGAVILGGCESGGTSTREMEAAAIAHARQELGLAETVPLEATVWIGEPREGQTVMCGTVSDRSPGGGAPPQRFAATSDPVNWLIFEGAHNAMVPSQPDKFPEWQALCGRGEQP
ncbi:MAG: hypothetical protein M3428_03375 [Pseudomonadota bacterium]|nr:hypothetical protein [Sphingomonas sp.]MDQ3471409.1 hypothetical protein [Pseudomonadota bacterium]